MDRGLINVLNMGKPINIYSMVLKILNDSNIDIFEKNNNNQGIKINFIGLRPGEKLHEELFHPNKILSSTDKKIFKENCDINLNTNEIDDIREKIKLSNFNNDISILQDMFSKYI